MLTREDRETLNAFIDGQLPPEEMKRVAALLAECPDWENYVRQQDRLKRALGMEAVIRAPVPERLLQTAQSAPVSWRWWLARQFSRRPGWILSQDSRLNWPRAKPSTYHLLSDPSARGLLPMWRSEMCIKAIMCGNPGQKRRNKADPLPCPARSSWRKL